MILLQLRRVRMYVLFFLKYHHMKNSDRYSLVKSVNYLPVGRNGFTESRFSEQQS